MREIIGIIFLPGLLLLGIMFLVNISNEYKKIDEEFKDLKKDCDTHTETKDPWVNDDPEKSIFDPDPVEVPNSFNKNLEDYKTLFNAKTDYLEEIINKKFEKDSITWKKYTELILKARTTFEEEMFSAGRMWDLNILINESEISEMYEKKIENINNILNEVEELMIEFIKSEYKPTGDNLKTLLEEIEYCKKGVDMYVQE